MYVYGWSKLLVRDNTQAASYCIRYRGDMQAVSDYELLLHNTKYANQTHCTMSVKQKKTLMYQQLIIIYLIDGITFKSYFDMTCL